MTGNQLKKERSALGLTQEEFAELTGYSRYTIISMESKEGAIPKRNAAVIQSVLNKVKNSNIEKKEAEVKTKQAVRAMNKKGFLTEPVPDLNNQQMSMAIMTTAATSAASLEMLSEVLSIVSKGSLEEAKEKARKLAQEKGLTLNYVLGILI